jgi:hypothetical protein
MKFFGFATSNGTAASSIKVRVSGVVGGFSGLTVGALYYVSNTVGTIATTPGTVQITVGIAVSATEVLIFNQPIGGLTTGTLVFSSADTTRGQNGTTYTKNKEIEILESGTFTITFDLRADNGADTAFGRVYKNDVAFGTEQTTSSTTFVEKSENLAFVAGDLIQLYSKNSAGGGGTEVRNFRLASGGRNPTLVITN